MQRGERGGGLLYPPRVGQWLMVGFPGTTGCLQIQAVFFLVIFGYFILEHPYLGGNLYNGSCLKICNRYLTFLNVFICLNSRYLRRYGSILVQSLLIECRHNEGDLLNCPLYFYLLFFQNGIFGRYF